MSGPVYTVLCRPPTNAIARTPLSPGPIRGPITVTTTAVASPSAPGHRSVCPGVRTTPTPSDSVDIQTGDDRHGCQRPTNVHLTTASSKVVKYTSICIAHYASASNALRHHTVLPANYTMPAFTPQPQSITALWLVLILPSHGG